MTRVRTFVAVIVAALLGVASPAVAAILTVNPDGTAAFTTIGAALAAAQNGDVILIGPGSYNESLDTAGKSVTLRSANGANQTSVDRLGATGTQLTIAGGTVTVEGITFRNGRNASMVVVSEGAAATFIACRWIGGIASEGAAVTITATATFQNCQFISNRASSRGGAIRATGATISMNGTAFQANQCTGTEGGALHLINTALNLSECTFIGNSSNSGSTSDGGAIWGQGVTGTWTNCTFLNNSATAVDRARGGDCFLLSSTPTITATTFTGSEAVVDRNSSGNWTIDAEGGSLWCGNSSAITMNGVTFSETRARAQGFTASAGCVNPVGNVRSRGGAVCLQSGSTATVSGSHFNGALARSIGNGNNGGCSSGCGCSWRSFTNCNAYGGAIFVGGASPLLTNCTFVECRAEVNPTGNQTGSQIAHGGAIYLENLSSPTILGSEFTGNLGQWGGAIYCTGQSSPFVAGTVFRENGSTSQTGTSAGRGGAIYSNDSAPSFAGCLFQHNWAGNIWPENGHAYMLVQTALSWTAARDAAVSAGGHLATITSAAENAFVHSLIPANQSVWIGGVQPSSSQEPAGGWTWVTGESWVYSNWQCNQPDNAGGNEHHAEMNRSNNGCADARWNDLNQSQTRWYIVEWSDPSQAAVPGAGGAFFVAGSAGFFPQIGTSTFCGNGGGDISGTFFNNGGNAFLIGCGSDCNGNGLDDTYEIAMELVGDCNGNGVPDSCEIAAKPLLDCNGNGLLDACESGSFGDCDGSGVPDECKPDCNGNGTPDSCEILAGLGSDCNGNGILDACEIASGMATDCDGSGLPDECKTDCDGNGVPDGCEIAANLLLDCDGDGVLDRCQIAANLSFDVNRNGVLDSCEVLNLTGIEIEVVPITGVLRTATTPLPLSAVCYRIYATFNDPAAQLVGVYGSENEGAMQFAAPAGFYNDPLGGGLAASRPCDPKSLFPELRYDSFLTVGGDCAGNSAELSVGVDFSEFLSGGALQSGNGMVLASPDLQQGYAGESGRVLIAQLTSMDGSIPQGQFNLIGFNGDGSQFYAFGVTWGGPTLVDCNGNGQQDAMDIAMGISIDCNRDGVPDDCQTDDPLRDCNANDTPDWCDIADGTSIDLDLNGIPDECECEGDVNGDGLVNVDDILIVLLAWGTLGPSIADISGDGIVDAVDLTIVLLAFGGCL